MPPRTSTRAFSTTHRWRNTPSADTKQRESSSTATRPATAAPDATPDDLTTGPAIQSFVSKLRAGSKVGAAATEPYAAYGTTEKLYRACAAAGEYTLAPTTASTEAGTSTAQRPEPLKTAAGEDVCHPATADGWHAAYGLPPTFSTWAQLAFLHLHVLQLRTRCFPAAHSRRWSQNLLDHFFYAAEDRMDTMHGIAMRGTRAKYLKDLFEQWRGAEISYDEGIVRGDAVLAAAVWRNVFQAREDVDAVAVAEVTAWMRRAARGLSRLSDAEFASARWKFGVPWEGREGVDKESMGIARYGAE